MQLENHLIYIDITQICGIGCEFCMYSDKHTTKDHLVLTDKAKKNISKLINDKETSKVAISGEGEPLNNIKAFKEILQLSKGGISFEFITSGYLQHDKLFTFYKDIDEILSKNNDTCNIRLSSDSYHIPKIKNKPHAISIKYFLENCFNTLTFSFRSIDIDKDFTREYLKKELKAYDINAHIITNEDLEDSLIVNGSEFKIEYKNLVNPTFIDNNEYMNLEEYIRVKEKRYGENFTLGIVTKQTLLNGMGITVKPNGDVFFYGIDNYLLANIHNKEINIDFFKAIVKNNSFIKKFYTIPFLEIMNEITKTKEIEDLIIKVNNPYWIIKELMKENQYILDGLGS